MPGATALQDRSRRRRGGGAPTPRDSRVDAAGRVASTPRAGSRRRRGRDMDRPRRSRGWVAARPGPRAASAVPGRRPSLARPGFYAVVFFLVCTRSPRELTPTGPRPGRLVWCCCAFESSSSSSSYYSPHRCKFNSKRQSSTLNSIQKDKKGPRFPRQIAPTRKWTHSSCISLSRESLLHTPVHPRIPAALIAAVG